MFGRLHHALARKPPRAFHSPTSTAYRHERINHGVPVKHVAPDPVRGFIGLVALLGGCAPIQPLVIDEPIGPLKWRVDDSRGSLIVYSASESSSLDPAEYGPRSDYTLYSVDAGFAHRMINRDNWLSRNPATLDLPVGRYTVTARGANFEFVTVSVILQGGRTTVVDLTQDVLAHATAANGDWVRLPNGQVIGSKSE